MPLVLVPLLFALPQAVPEPRIVHARVETRAVTGALEGEFGALVAGRGFEPFWIGWQVARAPRAGDSCYQGPEATPGRTVMLEGARHAVILFRVERREVLRIRTYSIDCEIDAGDLTMVWLTNVRSEESLRLLDSIAAASGDSRDAQRLASAAIYAIGAHAAPGALDMLIARARTEKRPGLRRAAFHAIGRRTEPGAFAFLEEILRR